MVRHRANEQLFRRIAVSGGGNRGSGSSDRRVELEDLDAAMEYVRQRRGDSRYFLASDSYNTGAFISMRTGEPVLPLYSEYRMDNVVNGAELNRMIEDGDIPLFLATGYLSEMDFFLYARMYANSRDATARAGLPARGEYRLFEVIRNSRHATAVSRHHWRNCARGVVYCIYKLLDSMAKPPK